MLKLDLSYFENKTASDPPCPVAYCPPIFWEDSNGQSNYAHSADTTRDKATIRDFQSSCLLKSSPYSVCSSLDQTKAVSGSGFGSSNADTIIESMKLLGKSTDGFLGFYECSYPGDTSFSDKRKHRQVWEQPGGYGDDHYASFDNFGKKAVHSNKLGGQSRSKGGAFGLASREEDRLTPAWARGLTVMALDSACLGGGSG